MNTTHYDEDAMLECLVGLPDLESLRTVESHARECHDCAEMFESLRVFVQTVAQPDAWSLTDPQLSDSMSQAGADTFATIARRRLEEEAQARLFVEDVLSGPSESWFERLTEPHAGRFGVVEELLEQSREVRDTRPSESHQLIAIAEAIARDLSPDPVDPDRLSKLEGDVLREKANTLRYLGDYPAALQALRQAEQTYRHTAIHEFDLAACDYVHATILVEMDRTNEALELARKSAETFLMFGHQQRYTHARLVEGAIRYQRGEIAEARDVWLSLLKEVQKTNDLTTLARLFNNVGHCFLELGDPDTAGTYFLQAILLYDELGMAVAKNRTRWGLGRMLVSNGRTREGLSRLQQTEKDFEALEMMSDAAVVTLDIVDALLILGETSQIAELCHDLVSRFTAAGMTSSAVAALAFLREAALDGRVTEKVLSHVRRHFTELPRKESLLFLPPQD